MKIKKPVNCSQEGGVVANPKISSNSHGTFSGPNEQTEKTEHRKEDGETEVSLHGCETLRKHSEVDAVGAKSSVEMNCVNDPNDGEGSEYSSLKNGVDLGNLDQKCKINNESVDGTNTLEQPKTESSSSNSTNFVLSTSSSDSYQGSLRGARTLKGTGTTNVNSSSMSSTCTELGYHHREIHVSNMESEITKESKQLEKITDVPKTNPSKTMNLEPAEEFVADINLEVVSEVSKGHLNVGEREKSALSEINLNEDMTNSNEMEQPITACCLKNVTKPIAIFARCEGPICESTPEVGFKGLGKAEWKGSTSTTSAFRPTCHLRGSNGSRQKGFKEIDLNVEASSIENEKEFPDRKDSSEEASSTREKFNIDLNVSSENDEDFQGSRTVRNFNLNDDPMASDPDFQGVEPSFRKEVMHDRESFLRNAGEHEPHYVGPMVLPRMTSMPVVLRVPEQAENATQDFPFNTPPLIEPQNHVFSLASSLHVPFYPAHLNGIPAAIHGVPNLAEFCHGPSFNNMVRVRPPCNQLDGMYPLENASSRGTGMQVFATPMYPMVPQLNNFQHGALPSLTPMKRRKPDVRWNSR